MKKILVVVPVLVVSAILSFSLYNSLDKKEVYEDTNYSFGKISMMLETEIGSKEYKEATTNEWPGVDYAFNSELSSCENGSSISWDATSKKVVFSGNLSDKCYVYFNKVNLPTLVEYVKSLYTGKQGDNNLYLHDASLTNGAGDNSYRFSGASGKVNNFVCFGYDSTDGTCPTDNLYRIIGVFSNKNGGTTVENVKLIKYDYAKSTLLGTTGDYKTTYKSSGGWGTSKGTNTQDEIGGYYWNYNGLTDKTGNNQYGSNTWSTSLLNKTNLNNNFTTKLGTTWSNKIATTTWKVGGNTLVNIVTQNAKTAYTNEIISPAANTTVNAKVGLMYVSDYMYAASPTYWTLVGRNNDATNDYRAAVNDNWMHMGLQEWTITPQSRYSYNVFFVDADGSVYDNSARNYIAVRPVLALESSITYAGGAGTAAEPILIK